MGCCEGVTVGRRCGGERGEGGRGGGVAATDTTNTVEHLKIGHIDTKVVQCSLFEG